MLPLTQGDLWPGRSVPWNDAPVSGWVLPPPEGIDGIPVPDYPLPRNMDPQCQPQAQVLSDVLPQVVQAAPNMSGSHIEMVGHKEPLVDVQASQVRLRSNIDMPGQNEPLPDITAPHICRRAKSKSNHIRSSQHNGLANSQTSVHLPQSQSQVLIQGNEGMSTQVSITHGQLPSQLPDLQPPKIKHRHQRQSRVGSENASISTSQKSVLSKRRVPLTQISVGDAGGSASQVNIPQGTGYNSNAFNIQRRTVGGLLYGATLNNCSLHFNCLHMCYS